MIDPVTLTVAALVRALIMASAKGAGEAAGADAYRVMKAKIVKKYPAASSSIESLERDPQSRERQEHVDATLRSLGGAHDPELARLADQLVAAIQGDDESSPDSGYPGNGYTGDPYADDRVAQAQRTAGVGAVRQTLDVHVRRLSEIRSRYLLDDSSLLSSQISRATDLPGEVRSELAALHGRIRQIIGQVAWNIETGRYQDTENLVQTLPGRSERERAARLVQADKSICVSYETLRLTVEFFSDLNSQVLERIERESSAQRQSHAMFGNAVMIYELADFMIGFIRDFAPAGLFELDALHEDALERIRKAQEGQKRLAAMAQQEGIEPGVRSSILEDVRQRDAALELLQKEWASYVAQTKQLHGRIGEVQNKIPTLELIRENARIQLDVLELVAMLRFLRQNAEAVRAAVRTLHGLRLVPLTPDRVRKLLGPGE
jgi:hypothetical protein